MCQYRHIQCRHCKKNFTVYKAKGRLIFLGIDIALLVFINILLFHFLNFDLIGLLVFTLIFFGLSLLILPFTVKFKKYKEIIEKTKKNTDKKKWYLVCEKLCA